MTDSRELNLLSIVAPFYNEEQSAHAFYERVVKALEAFEIELVLVNDGSKDATLERLRAIAADDERVKVVDLSRNFGHQAALTAGLEHARGDVVVMLDSDLQDPPELIPRMVDEWRGGSDIVYAVRETRSGETKFKLATAHAFYRLFAKITRLELTPDSGDFRLMSRRALDALLSMPERNRFLRGMTVWVGFRQSAVKYHRDPRLAGETKFTFSKMLRFSLDAISSFSHAPLQAATLLGFVVSILAFLAIPATIIARFTGAFVPGWASALIVVLLLGGIQLITVGLIGEYVGRIYDEVKRRPLYLVNERINMPDGSPKPAVSVDLAERQDIEQVEI
jgi:dolichol-phosphate mannosyltransferase